MPEQRAKRVLVVDDSVANRYAVARMLRSAGMEVVEAGTGAEALRQVEVAQPDVVVLDVHLPDISGFDVCRRIKERPQTASTPVLHISAVMVEAASQVRGLDSGADAYLTHPFEPPVLLASINSLLRLRQAEERIRLAAQQWNATFDAITDAVCLLDNEGRIVRCNRAYFSMAGRTAGNLEGLDYTATL